MSRNSQGLPLLILLLLVVSGCSTLCSIYSNNKQNMFLFECYTRGGYAGGQKLQLRIKEDRNVGERAVRWVFDRSDSFAKEAVVGNQVARTVQEVLREENVLSWQSNSDKGILDVLIWVIKIKSESNVHEFVIYETPDEVGTSAVAPIHVLLDKLRKTLAKTAL